ncbi:hypothetical protein [Helicobacter pylori]|nr:hypothetical protein [Helicobacter pylori]
MRQKKAPTSLKKTRKRCESKRASHNANAHAQNRTKNAYKRA